MELAEDDRIPSGVGPLGTRRDGTVDGRCHSLWQDRILAQTDGEKSEQGMWIWYMVQQLAV